MNFEFLTDKNYGIIKNYGVISMDHNFKYYFGYAVSNDFSSILKDKQKIIIKGGGIGLNKDKAIKAAIGEVIERYCCCFYKKSEIIYGNFNDLTLKNNLLDPKSIETFNDNQIKKEDFIYKKLERKDNIYWIKSKNIEEKIFLIPLEVILFRRVNYGNKKYFLQSSNGKACADSYEEAEYKSILELVERDSITNIWYNRLSMDVIKTPNYIIELLNKTLNCNFNYNFSVKIIDFTSDLEIPVYFAVLFQNNEYISCGAAANLNKNTAIWKAVKESIQNLPRVFNKEYDISIENVKDFDDHFFYYINEKNKKYLNFLFSRTPIQDNLLDNFYEKNFNFKTGLKNLKNKLLDKKKRVFSVDMTTNEVKENKLFVVSSYSPDLVNLNSGINNRYLGMKRIYEFPKLVGLKKVKKLNEFPHPFP